ncbi:MAG: exosortase/archaeosortase family protein [Desulfuromonadaceae bacterium]|nr:exosortase/archaeosortase family protein [Desulfuromonadaceae bacterium]MDD5104837.1 exosortase/archaeosortase family protein [Desulfuromonadaceae bacterium]
MSVQVNKNRLEEPVRIIVWVLLFAAFAAVYYPVLSGLVKAWNGSDDYSHGFLILPLSAYILWQNRSTLVAQPVEGSWFGLPLALFALFLFLLGKFGSVLTLPPISLILFIWSAVIFFFGFKMFRICSFPLLFLIFMIPVPEQIFAALTNPLQFIVTKITVSLASMMGVIIYREGNVIHLSDMTFQVVQACSGLRSIMTMLTLGAILGYFTLRSSLLRLILVVAGVPIAIAVNIFRVFTMVIAYNYFKFNLTEGTPHTILGLLVFALGFVFFIIFQKGLAKCEK